ncbi:transporter substrate-binding domain-containing protein [Pseudomonas sp. LS44]|uniref:substrate-binding periplasmic protein n=1 Tax=Pseudomonas sp. LS44 TaxID=1357074 RepID=UPI00215A347C|nr:transporter substrate-binding domain-containing protein [Pseudomonas sp. LS44]UVE16311.1 transporter substrate-binding domain-containing protein [Pseudomonas sp. LS44]
MKSLFRYCLFAGLLPVAAHAETYVVGVEQADFEPYFSVDAQGNYQGFTRDLLDRFARDAGITLTYKAVAPAELLDDLLKGRVDLKFPDSPYWAKERKAEKKLTYSSAVVEFIDGVMVAPTHQGKSIQLLKRLAVVQGWTPEQYRDSIASGHVTRVDSANLREMIRSTLKKQADGAYYNIEVAIHYLNYRSSSPNALVFDSRLPYSRGSYHLSTIKQPQLVERFNRFLNEHSGEVAALKTQYRVEENINSEFLGVEQWKVDFIKRQRAKEQPQSSN